MRVKKLLGSRVLVDVPMTTKKTTGGIITTTKTEDYRITEVLEVGTPKSDEIAPLKGDKVMIPTNGGIKVKLEDKEYMVLNLDQVIMIVE